MKIRPESITTYGELRDALPQTGNRKVPKIRQLKKDAKLILQRRTDSGTIRIYNNGFFTYEESGRATVYGVDRCERPETYAYRGQKEEAPGEVDFSGYPWELILECAGAARLSHNACQRERSICRSSPWMPLHPVTTLPSASDRNMRSGIRKKRKQPAGKRCWRS